MATIFTRIIQGELPGRFVWRDETAVAFLSINPISTGHALVVPVAEVDHWLDLDDATIGHLTLVARRIGDAQLRAFAPPRIGLVIAGMEVPHTHLHVMPIASEADLHLDRGRPDPDPAEMDDARDRIAAALRELGHGDHVPD
ncbi:MAG: HIT family protein [Acidimicrobiia bacterium]